jgi:hypothetical protein
LNCFTVNEHVKAALVEPLFDISCPERDYGMYIIALEQLKKHYTRLYSLFALFETNDKA